jgi:hypothetical protein
LNCLLQDCKLDIVAAADNPVAGNPAADSLAAGSLAVGSLGVGSLWVGSLGVGNLAAGDPAGSVAGESYPAVVAVVRVALAESAAGADTIPR